MAKFTLEVNGEVRTVEAAGDTPLLWVLRDHLGLVGTKYGGGVRLLRPEELKNDWDPTTDKRFTVWEATHHLLRVYWHEKAGDEATAALLRKLGSGADLARELAYRLFNVCEKRKWSQEAQAYNALVVGWPELAKLARESHASAPLLFETS